MSDPVPPLSRPAARRGSALHRLLPLFAVLVVAGLVIAWIDGGERALRPIAQEVLLPPAQPALVPELVPVGGEG
jgi:hypothetical protein